MPICTPTRIARRTQNKARWLSRGPGELFRHGKIYSTFDQEVLAGFTPYGRRSPNSATDFARKEEVLGHETAKFDALDIEYSSLRTLVNGKSITYSSFGIESGLTGMAARRGRDWKGIVKGMLKAELKRQGLSYADLAERLAAVGVKDNEVNIKNKINRGTFTAIFFVQCLEAIGCKTLHLGDE